MRVVNKMVYFVLSQSRIERNNEAVKTSLILGSNIPFTKFYHILRLKVH